MRTTIKATGSVLLTEELKVFVDEKVEKLAKVLGESEAALAEVEVGSVSNARTGDMFRAEINISFDGLLVRAEASRETLHMAIDEAVDEARRRIRRSRTKHRDLIRRGAARVKGVFRYFRGKS